MKVFLSEGKLKKLRQIWSKFFSKTMVLFLLSSKKYAIKICRMIHALVFAPCNILSKQQFTYLIVYFTMLVECPSKWFSLEMFNVSCYEQLKFKHKSSETGHLSFIHVYSATVIGSWLASQSIHVCVFKSLLDRVCFKHFTRRVLRGNAKDNFCVPLYSNKNVCEETERN